MLRNFERLRGVALGASDGEVGDIRDLYFEVPGWFVRYLVAETGSWLAQREVLITPAVLGQFHEHARSVDVHLSKEQVRNSPPVETTEPISREYEVLYHRHYGWEPYWTTVSATPGVWEDPTESIPESGRKGESTEKVPRSERNRYLWRACDVIGYILSEEDGEIGHVEDFVIDDQEWRIRYIVVGTGRWLPGKKVLLAPEWIEKISFEASELLVKLPRAIVQDAPEYDPRNSISHEFEQRLRDHYEHAVH